MATPVSDQFLLFFIPGSHQVGRFWSLYWPEKGTQNRFLQRNIAKRHERLQ